MDFIRKILNNLFFKITRSTAPESTKADIVKLIEKSIEDVSAGTKRIEEQIEDLKRIERQIDSVVEDETALGTMDDLNFTKFKTSKTALDHYLDDIAAKTGASPEEARRVLIERANEGYPPGDPKRMLDEDDDRLRAYIESQKLMGNEEDLMVDIIENAELPEDQLSAIREIAEGAPDMSIEQLTEAEAVADDLLKINRQKQTDLARAEELMMDIENFGKSFDEIMDMVQAEKVIPINRPKKAEGGIMRIGLQDGGGLGKDLSIQDYMRLAGFKDFVSPATPTPVSTSTLKKATKDPGEFTSRPGKSPGGHHGPKLNPFGLPQLANVTQSDFSKFEDEYNQLLEKRKLFDEAVNPRRARPRRPGMFDPFKNPKFSKIMSKEENERLGLLRNTFISPFGEEKGGGPIAPFGLTEDGRPILNPSINRIGLQDGGGPKIGRRGFLGMLGAGIGSLFMPKGVKQIAEMAAPARVITPAPGMPDWFPLLVNQIKTKGKITREPKYDDFTSGGDTTVRYKLKDESLSGGEIFLEEDLQSGAVGIFGRGDDGQQVAMDYYPGERMATKSGVKESRPTFEAGEFFKGEIQDFENIGVPTDDLRGGLMSWEKLSGVNLTPKEKIQRMMKNFEDEFKNPNIEPGDDFTKKAQGGGVGSLFKERTA